MLNFNQKTALGAFLLFLGAVGCSSRQIHPELKADSRVAVRKWTLQTRESGKADAGERGYEFSNPVFFEQTILFGNQTSGLVSLYPGLLSVRWVLPIAGGVLSEITVDRDSAYFVGGDGFLYGVQAETGRVRWRYELRNPSASKPTVSGGRLFVTTTDDTIYAFDAGTGKWLWHYRRRTSPASTIRGASTPLVEGGEVIAGLSDGFLVGVGVDDGQLKWEKKLHSGVKFTDVDASPVLDQGVLFVPSYDGALYAIRRKGAETLWKFEAGGSKRVWVEGDRVYFPSTDGQLYALHKVSGKLLWKFELDKGVPTQGDRIGRFVLVGSSHQYLYLIDAVTGKAEFRFNAGDGSGFIGAPLVDSQAQKFYALSSGGNLYSFQVAPEGTRSSQKFSGAFIEPRTQ